MKRFLPALLLLFSLAACSNETTQQASPQPPTTQPAVIQPEPTQTVGVKEDITAPVVSEQVTEPTTAPGGTESVQEETLTDVNDVVPGSTQITVVQPEPVSEYPPMFSGDDNVPPEIGDAVRGRIEAEWTEAFGKYYQVLGFEASNINYTEANGGSELEFNMNMVTRNFYKDPDTVPYIKELKDSGSPSYQQLYDEYNAPMDNNFHMKAVVGVDGSIELFANDSPVEVDFRPVKASDYIMR